MDEFIIKNIKNCFFYIFFLHCILLIISYIPRILGLREEICSILLIFRAKNVDLTKHNGYNS